MGLQEFPSKPVNKGGVIIGTVNGPTEVAIGAENSYLVADSTTTPGAKWQTYRKYNTVQLTSGTSWTVPAAVEMIDVLMIGGGQGGGGCSTNTTANNVNTASGGAGGAIYYKRNYPVTPGATITYSIGSGGAGGAAPGAASQNSSGGNGGNTTFGALVCPGANTRVGSLYGYSTTGNQYRGIFDLVQWDSSGSASDMNSNIDPQQAGVDLGWDTWFIGFYATSSTAASPFNHPLQYFGDMSGWSSRYRYMGITNTFDKILTAYTPPTGGTAAPNELNANTVAGGWGAYGGNGANRASGNRRNNTWHGAGMGANINSSTTGVTRTGTAGAAAANTGSGGGGAAAITGSAAFVASAGGAGGSGVIFLGYWA